MIKYNDLGDRLFRVVITYDNDQDYTEISEYDLDNRLEFRTEFEYDQGRRLLKEHQFISQYISGKQQEIPHKLILHEYDFYPEDIRSH